MIPNFADMIAPVDQARFQFAFDVFYAAAAMKGPYPNPQQFSVNIVESDGDMTKMSFTDVTPSYNISVTPFRS